MNHALKSDAERRLEDVQQDACRLLLEPRPNMTSPVFACAVILLAACIVGVHSRNIILFTKLPRLFVVWAGIEARKLGIFRKGAVAASWWLDNDPEGVGALSFCLDAMALAGVVTRSRTKPWRWSHGSYRGAAMAHVLKMDTA